MAVMAAILHPLHGGMELASDRVMRGLRIASAAAVLALTLAACASEEPSDPSARAELSAPAGTDAEVSIENERFSVDEISIQVGETVTWRNRDEMGHTITHGEDGAPATSAMFDEPVSVDQTVSFTFEEPGEYPVTCTIHPQMQMTVIVAGAP
jgi:plastocyanin